jgi:uncharacterized protein YukE
VADFEVDPAALREYAQVVEGLHQAVNKVGEYMQATACDTSGFTGLFYLLRPVVDLVGKLYGETLQFGHERLTSLSQGIQSAANAYAAHDEHAKKMLDELRAMLESAGGRPGEPGGIPDDFPTMPHPAGR